MAAMAARALASSQAAPVGQLMSFRLEEEQRASARRFNWSELVGPSRPPLGPAAVTNWPKPLQMDGRHAKAIGEFAKRCSFGFGKLAIGEVARR